MEVSDEVAAQRSKETALGGFEPTFTQQHFKDECDINNILKRVEATGVLPTNTKAPVYGDFTVVPKSLLEAFGMIKQANDLFMALPAVARERFNNDPEKMVAFLNDPQNREEAFKLGLVKAPVVAEVPAEPAKAPEAPKEGPAQ